MLGLRTFGLWGCIFFLVACTDDDSDSTSLSANSSPIPGWPSGQITNGSVSSASSNAGDFNFDTLKTREVESVFTYAVNGGNDTYTIKKIPDPSKTMNLITQARALESAYGNSKIVRPVIVVYTAGGSSGAEAISIDLGQDPGMYPDNLWIRYYNLIRIAQVAQAAKDDDHPVPATLIINPDFLGEVHKSCTPTYCPVNYKTIQIPSHDALEKAFTELMDDGFIKTKPDLPEFLNASTVSFGNYMNSINWLLTHFSPDVPFGWQDNIWAGDPLAHKWIHKAATASKPETVIDEHITAESTYLNDLKVFNTDNPYKPDFIAFDKWERDNWDPTLDGAGINNGYMYNAPAWQVYFAFIKGVRAALSDIPVMLFQIPGGHLQVVNDVDTRDNHASTAPSYILGDPKIDSGLSNLKSYIVTTTFKSPETDYYVSSNSVDIYLKTCPTDPTYPDACVDSEYSWRQSHWSNLMDQGIFAIMWGGGSTTSIVSLSEPLDDSGWLYDRLKAVVGDSQE